MKKIILLTVVTILFSGTVIGQENRISLGFGYPLNLTDHWLIDKWEKPLHLDLKYLHTKNMLVFGGGLKYSKFEVAWFRYYDSDKNSISDVTPYVQAGFNFDKSFVSLIPHVDVGYSALVTDIEIYNGGKGGFYSAVGLDCNFNLFERIQLGLGANYSMIFNKLDFNYEGAIQHDFIPKEDDIMKSIFVSLNVAYRL